MRADGEGPDGGATPPLATSAFKQQQQDAHPDQVGAEEMPFVGFDV